MRFTARLAQTSPRRPCKKRSTEPRLVPFQLFWTQIPVGTALVAVVVWLVRPVDGHTYVVGLLLR